MGDGEGYSEHATELARERKWYLFRVDGLRV